MEKYKKNEVVVGLVTGIEQYGIFVSLDEDSSGLIHISEVYPKVLQSLKSKPLKQKYILHYHIQLYLIKTLSILL